MICEHCGKEFEHNIYEDTVCPHCGQKIEKSEVQLKETFDELSSKDQAMSVLKIFFTVLLMIIIVPVLIILLLI